MLLMCLENLRSVVNKTPKSVSLLVEEIAIVCVSLKELIGIHSIMSDLRCMTNRHSLTLCYVEESLPSFTPLYQTINIFLQYFRIQI